MNNDDNSGPSRRGALVAMAVIVLVIIGAIYMVQQLHQSSVIQDCVMAGRSNCAKIDTDTLKR